MQFKELGSLFNSFGEMSSKRFKGISSIEDMNGLQKNSFDEFLKLNSSGVSAYTMNQIKAKSAILELTDSLTAQGVALAKDADFSAKAATGKLTFRKALDENKDSILDIGKALEKSDLLDDVWKQSLQKAKSGGIDEYKETVENILSLHNEVADSIINLGTATTQSTSGLSGLKSTLTGIAASAKSLFVTLATNPLTWITAATVAAIALEDALTIDYGEAHEALDTSTSKYQEAQSELEALKSEAESYKNTLSSIADNYDIGFSGTESFGEMINKLNNADLSLVDQAEVDKIKTANTDLERQIELQEKLTAMSSKEYINDAKTAMNTGDRSVAQSVKFGDSKGEKNFKGEVGNVTDTEAVKEDLALIEKYNAKIPELEKKVISLKEETSNLSFGDNGYFGKNAELKSAQDELEHYKESIETLNSDLSSRSESIQSNLSALKLDPTANAKQIKELEDVLNSINNIDLSPTEQELNTLNSFFSSTAGNAIGDYLNNVVAESGNAEDALNKFKELGLSLDDIGVSQDSFIKYFQDVAKSAEQAKEKASAVGTTLSDVDAAFKSENQDANWTKFADYATQARDLAKQGKWGTDDLQKSIEWVLPKFDVESQLKKNGGDFEYIAEVYEKKYKDAKKLYKKYFDAENPKDSAVNFQNDLIDKGLLKKDETGLTGTFKNTAKAAKDMGLSIEATEAALRNLESYGFEWDDVMFSGEGITDYENALNKIKSIRDSMSEGDAKERLDRLIDGEGGWEEKYKEYQNDLSKLTSKDQIVHIEFEYDLAQLDAEIAELEKNVVNGDGKDIKENAALLAKKQTRRDTAEKYLTEDRGMKIPVEYENADKAISELQNKLKQSGLSEDQKVELQAEITNLTDMQNNLLNAFDDSGMSWDDFIKTDTFDKFVSDTKSKIEDLNGESVDLEGDIDTSKIDSKLDGVFSNNGKTIMMNIDASPEQIQAQLDKLQTGQKLTFNAGVDGKQANVTATKNMTGEITYTAVVDGVETILTQNGTVNYTIGDQESPEDKNSNVNYNKGAQEDPEDKNALLDYNKDKQEEPENKNALLDYIRRRQDNPENKNAGVYYNKSGQEAPSDKTANVFYKAVGSAAGGAIRNAVNAATGAVKLNGTAHKSGTAKDNNTSSHAGKKGFLSKIGNGIKRAFASGTLEDDSFIKDKWRTKKSETALTGEEGQELVATRDNKWFTVGDNGAEFAHIPAGSVVFNAKQTEELLKNGSINSRGKAYLSGTAYAGGRGGRELTSSSSTKKKNTKKKSNSTTKSKGKGKGKGKDTTKKDSKKFKETFDWIEVAIDRIERAIERLNTAATSIYRSWSVRNKNLKSEISSVNKEIKIQQQGFKRYNKEADKVSKTALKKAKDEGFTKTQWDSLTKKVRDGKIDISTIKNEKLATRIKEYKEWHEKALDCKDAIVELEEKVSELYETAFNDVVTKYEGGLSVIEHKKNMLDEAVSQSEEKGYITSVKYYDALIKNENANIDKLKKERTELIKTLNEGVKKGNIKKESEAWYEMVGQINDVTLAIEESNTAIIEFSNSIRDIQWEIFDLLQKKITHITDESKFLTDLLSNDKLYTDKGQLTDEGLATMGLHGVNYNVDMAQADKYAKEIANLDKQIAKNPYDQNLLERRQELLELQQDMILAAEDEKQAIRDMVEEGINKELDSLKDLIDTYTEAMDAQKDLYDYQKRVKDQTKEIANLQKMLDAYKGDTSEEAKSKVQEYKVSLEEAKDDLEETEYDRYVSDQKKMLDTLYDEYEEILNKRLDNIEALVSDMIVKINENAGNINSTLSEKAESVGYDLSSSMESIWGGAKDVLTTYGEYIKTGIENAATTVNATLGIINVNIQNMISQLNALANTKVQSANTSSASDQKKSTTSNNPGSIVVKQPSQPIKQVTLDYNKSKGNGKAEVGDKVTFSSGKYYSSSAGTGVSGTKNRGKSVYITRIKKGAKKPYHISTGKKLGSGDLGWVNLNQLKGYAKGTARVTHDQLAWTQENNEQEMIIRGDGAVLTPLEKNDMVINPKQVETLRAMLTDYSNNTGFDSVASAARNFNKISNTNNNVANNEIHMNFELPNVKNADDFIDELQHSKRFEGMVQAMTVGQMSGGSSLRKYRF